MDCRQLRLLECRLRELTQGTLISLAAVVPDCRRRMIDGHPFENAVADDIGTPVENAPPLIGEALSQHELAPDKVLRDRAHRHRNAPKTELLAHDARSFRR